MKKFFKKNIVLMILLGSFIGASLLFIGNEVQAVTCPAGGFDSSSGVCIPTSTGLPDAGGDANPVAKVISNFMLWLLGLIGIIGIIALVVSGIQYLVSAGDEGMIETAKKNTKWSIVGIIVALASFVIIKAIDSWLRGNLGF